MKQPYSEGIFVERRSVLRYNIGIAKKRTILAEKRMQLDGWDELFIEYPGVQYPGNLMKINEGIRRIPYQTYTGNTDTE